MATALAYRSFLTRESFIEFIRLCDSISLGYKGSRNTILEHLANSYYLQDSTHVIDFFDQSHIVASKGIIVFLSSQFAIDFENSKGNRTEHLNIEFNKALEKFIDYVNILRNVYR